MSVLLAAGNLAAIDHRDDLLSDNRIRREYETSNHCHDDSHLLPHPVSPDLKRTDGTHA
jgi:hypothetical protein